jgi:hypothetical protein
VIDLDQLTIEEALSIHEVPEDIDVKSWHMWFIDAYVKEGFKELTLNPFE